MHPFNAALMTALESVIEEEEETIEEARRRFRSVAETEEAEPEEVPEVVGGVAEVPATQTTPHRTPVTSIGAMARSLALCRPPLLSLEGF